VMRMLMEALRDGEKLGDRDGESVKLRVKVALTQRERVGLLETLEVWQTVGGGESVQGSVVLTVAEKVMVKVNVFVTKVEAETGPLGERVKLS